MFVKIPIIWVGQSARIKRGLTDFILNLYTYIDIFEHKLFYLSRV